MVSINRPRHILAALVSATLLAGIGSASAQDITDAHLKAARAAVTAIKATDSMDAILPQANQLLKVELIQKNPDLEAEIVRITDEETIALAPRRGDLEKEVATAFARAFTEQELNEIAAFHNSPTGQKFLSDSRNLATGHRAGPFPRCRHQAECVGAKRDAAGSSRSASRSAG
jgi:hypothetical protein